MGSACRTFFDRIHEKYSGPLAKPVAFANRFSLLLHTAASWIIYFIMEAVSRHSVPAAWEFMTGSTAAFAYNSFMIFMSFMLVYLFRRRIFMRLLIAFFWLVLGIINGTILSSRVTPFTGQDLHLITDALDIVGNYMSPVQLILKAGGVVLGIAVLVLLWKYAPKYQGKLRYPLNLAALAAVIGLFAGATRLCLEQRVLSTYFGNIAFAYEDYGLPYCFFCSLLATGMDEPYNYSEETIEAIVRRDEEALESLFQAMIRALDLEGNYMILLAHDAYDVPYRGKDGEDQADASSEVFSYLVCAVCPVKLTKPALSYQVQAGEFRTRTADWVVSPPELGFLFPAFDDRSANIYDALYYSKDVKNVHEDLIGAVFAAPAPMPAAAQQESFRGVLGEALEEDCCLPVVQAVHDQLCGLMEDHKESRDPELLTIGKGEVKQALAANGVSQEHIQAFERQYDQAFGPDAQLSPRNLVAPKKLELKTADVTIKVNPERGDLVQTRILNGVKYSLVRVEEGVEVNGVPVQITQ